MSNDLAVKTSQLTNAVKQMSDYLKGKIDDNTTQLNESVKHFDVNKFDAIEVKNGDNVFNYTKALVGKKMNIVSGAIQIVDDASIAISDYIPVNTGEKFTVDKTSNGAILSAYFDDNKNYLSSKIASGWLGETFTVPENAKYMRVNVFIQKRNVEGCMIIKGEVYPNSYVQYRNNKVMYSIPWLFNNEKKVDNRKLYLPNKIYAQKGAYLRIPYESITNNYTNLYFESQTDNKVCKDLYYQRLLNSSQTDFTEYINMYDNIYDKPISFGSTKICVSDISTKNPSSAKNLLVLGDSFIENQVIPDQIKTTLTAKGLTNIKMIGGKTTTAGTKHQGMHGYSFNDFVTNPADRPADRKASFPDNPYWNTSTNRLDFKNYISSISATTVDYVIVHLGVNDIFYRTDEELIQDARTFLTQLKTDYPNAKVVVDGLVPISKYSDQYICARVYNKRIFEINKKFETMVDSLGGNLHFNNIATTFDANFGYKPVEKEFYRMSTEKEKGVADYLHPGDAGYCMIADRELDCLSYYM